LRKLPPVTKENAPYHRSAFQELSFLYQSQGIAGLANEIGTRHETRINVACRENRGGLRV
jgi:hypothetical protein